MVKAGIRVYTRKVGTITRPSERKLEADNLSRIIILWCRYKNDHTQHLLEGYYTIYCGERIEREGIYYDEKNISKEELDELTTYSTQHELPRPLERQTFVEKVLFKQLELGTYCVSFDLPLQLTRLAVAWGAAEKWFYGGFSIQLSPKKKYPRLLWKHLDAQKSFISLGTVWRNQEQIQGHFADIKTLVCTVTSLRNPNLWDALNNFKIEIPQTTARTMTGIVDNLRSTVTALHKLFRKCVERVRQLTPTLPIRKTYSGAAVAKQTYFDMGIKPYLIQNPDDTPEHLGNLMSGFFGGWCDVRRRKELCPVTVLDFFSTYPTLFCLMDLWKYHIAEKIEPYEAKEEVQALLDRVTLEDVRKPELYPQLVGVALIVPEGTTLPLRARYAPKEPYTIGMQVVTSTKPMWVTIADLVQAKIQDGKAPKVLRATKYRAIGQQQGLKPVTILGKTIDPSTENPVKVIAELRHQLKKRIIPEAQRAADALKPMLNSMSYGIFVEFNEETEEVKELEVYADKTFRAKTRKNRPLRYEKPGEYSNPIIAVTLIATARLLLTATETILRKHGETPAFCDTDSMAVNPRYVAEIREFFSKLSPYASDENIFAIQRMDVEFYGICPKRYALIKADTDDIIIERKNDYKTHGLVFEKPLDCDGDWRKEFWIDIIKLHKEQITLDELMEKYHAGISARKMSVSTWETYKRFIDMNKDLPPNKQIRPGNFMLFAKSTDKNVKIIAPWTKNIKIAMQKDFINYKINKVMNGEHYWKRMDKTFLDYINKTESKLDGDSGILTRKHITIDGFKYIGKETKELEETGTLKEADYNTYDDPEELTEKLKLMTYAEARKLGIAKATLHDIKEKIAEGSSFSLTEKTRKKLRGL